MSSMSKAIRGQMARDYEETAADDLMAGAANIAPDASAADHVRLSLLQLLLPDLLQAVETIIVDSDDNEATRSMAGGLLSYVCNPLDIIGDDLPLGRVDDAIICALGLKRLRELDGVVLSPHVAAACEVAESSLSCLGGDLRESIVDFTKELERSTRRGST